MMSFRKWVGGGKQKGIFGDLGEVKSDKGRRGGGGQKYTKYKREKKRL